MPNHTPNNQQNNQAGKKPEQNPAHSSTQQATPSNKQTVQRAPTADQPTPVSVGTQRQGTSSGQPNRAPATEPEIKQVGRELADDAKQTVDNAAREVKQQANELRHQAQDQAAGFFNEQKDVAAQRVGGVAEALRQAGQEFADRDEGMLAHYTESLAGQLDNFSHSLRDREIGSLLEDAKELAYRQPELFVAGALAAGFVLGRFFKSSRRASAADYAYQGGAYGQRYSSYESGYGHDYEGISGGYGSRYGGYDPRDPTRPYGEPYGQRYDEQFSQDRGPAHDTGQRSGAQPRGTFDQGSDQEYGQGSRPTQHDRQARNSQWSSGPVPRDQQGQVTTHGLGTGQSIQREEELEEGLGFGQGDEFGQEFGQGEEQVSNYKGNETKKASDLAKGPNQRTDQQRTDQQGEERQEGELR